VGPLAMAGLICLGAALGLGLVSSHARSARDPADALQVRGMFIVTAAFVQGIGVLSVVGGIISVIYGKAGGAPSAVLAAGLALSGTVLGIALILRQLDRVDRPAALLGAMFTTGLGTLGAVIGILAIVLDERATTLPPDWPFVAIGLVSGICALAAGWFGGRAQALATTDGADLAAIRAGMLRRQMPVVVVGNCAVAVAILILLFG
jgi:F0F1-type ATP synthase membrane subunit c/vacuolar-type H+-ATPase subunit K